MTSRSENERRHLDFSMVYRRGIASKARYDVNLGIGAPQIHPTALAAGQILSEQTIKVSKYLNNPDKPVL
jgi:hypothetical protein